MKFDMRKMLALVFIILSSASILYATYRLPPLVPNVHATGTPIPVNQILSDVVTAPSQTAYLIVGDWELYSTQWGSLRTPAAKCGGVSKAAATDSESILMLSGGTVNSQFVILDTQSAYVSQSTCGQPLVSSSSPIVAAGGQLANEVVYYYVQSGQSQLYWSNGCIIRRDTTAVITCNPASSTVDYFVIDAFKDSQGRPVYLLWGIGWQGTTAAFTLLMNQILHNPNSFTASWYIYSWQDGSGTSANAMVDPNDIFHQMVAGPSSAGPSAGQLQTSIAEGSAALARLYKGDNAINTGQSANSEYFALPLKVYNFGVSAWAFAGQPKCGSPYSPLFGFDTIANQITGTTSESSDYKFFKASDAICNGDTDSPKLHADINYAYSPTQISITITCAAYVRGSGGDQVYLGSTYLGVCDAGHINTQWIVIDDASSASHLQAFRYTIRHVSEMGHKIWRSFGSSEEGQLWSTGNAFGFLNDFYDDALFHYDWSKYLDYNQENYWHECARRDEMPSGYPASSSSPPFYFGMSMYPYYSGICNIPGGWSAYVYFESQYDVLMLQALALKYLELYHNPDYNFPSISRLCGFSFWTPRIVARCVEGQIYIPGEGVPAPGQFGSTTSASSVRTALFLSLESWIGYVYGDGTSQSYADKVATILSNDQNNGGVQIAQSGQIVTTDYGTITRKQYAGAWPIAWDPNKATSTGSFIRSLMDVCVSVFVCSSRPQQNEYAGYIPTNGESIASIIGALDRYLEFKYPTWGFVQSGSSYVGFAETEFFNTGTQIFARVMWFPHSGTYTIHWATRTFGAPCTNVNFYLDGSVKQSLSGNCGSTGSFTITVNKASWHTLGVQIQTTNSGMPNQWWVASVWYSP